MYENKRCNNKLNTQNFLPPIVTGNSSYTVAFIVIKQLSVQFKQDFEVLQKSLDLQIPI